MSLPPLHNLNPTRSSLQRAAQVISALRKAFIKQQINALHLALFVTPTGLTTGQLAGGNEFFLDFFDLAFGFRDSTGRETRVAMADSSPKMALTALASAMPTVQFNVTQLVVRGDFDMDPFEIDPAVSAELAEALYASYTAFARFRGRLLGGLTPLVVWPHGFDLSTLWFPGFNADEESQPHCNFGFSPGSAGLDRPYFYAYVHPRPENLMTASLPALARWHTDNWVGVVIDYDAVAAQPDPLATLEATLIQTQAALAAKMQP